MGLSLSQVRCRSFRGKFIGKYTYKYRYIDRNSYVLEKKRKLIMKYCVCEYSSLSKNCVCTFALLLAFLAFFNKTIPVETSFFNLN